jgi:GGDEF domain-containing protein
LKVLRERLEDFAPSLVERAFQYLGEALLIQGMPEEALPNLRLALISSTQNGHYSSEARVQGATGYAYHLCGDNETALRMLTDSIETAPEATSMKDLSLLNQWQSKVLEASGDPVKSLHSLRVSIEYDKRVHLSRMERWAKVHDLTLGINNSLVSHDSIAFLEHDWVYSQLDLTTHLELANKALKGDPLTGVHNREEVIELSKEAKFSVAAVFEIQNLDQINRKFVRAVGDEVLRNVATVLIANSPNESIVGRYSGNEFYVATSEDQFDSVLMAFNKFPWLAIDPELSVKVGYRRVLPDKPHLLAA